MTEDLVFRNGINKQKYSKTLLMKAVEYNNFEAVEAILKRGGVDLYIVDRRDKNVFNMMKDLACDNKIAFDYRIFNAIVDRKNDPSRFLIRIFGIKQYLEIINSTQLPSNINGHIDMSNTNISKSSNSILGMIVDNGYHNISSIEMSTLSDVLKHPDTTLYEIMKMKYGEYGYSYDYTLDVIDNIISFDDSEILDFILDGLKDPRVNNIMFMKKHPNFLFVNIMDTRVLEMYVTHNMLDVRNADGNTVYHYYLCNVEVLTILDKYEYKFVNYRNNIGLTPSMLMFHTYTKYNVCMESIKHMLSTPEINLKYKDFENNMSVLDLVRKSGNIYAVELIENLIENEIGSIYARIDSAKSFIESIKKRYDLPDYCLDKIRKLESL